MDSRLNLAMRESHEADLARAPPRLTRRRRWPDDGLPVRKARRHRSRSLHPFAVMAAHLTWR